MCETKIKSQRRSKQTNFDCNQKTYRSVLSKREAKRRLLFWVNISIYFINSASYLIINFVSSSFPIVASKNVLVVVIWIFTRMWTSTILGYFLGSSAIDKHVLNFLWLHQYCFKFFIQYIYGKPRFCLAFTKLLYSCLMRGLHRILIQRFKCEIIRY